MPKVVTTRRTGAGSRVRAFSWGVPSFMQSSRVRLSSFCLFYYLIGRTSPEILVDVVDVVLKGSSIPEKLLGVTLFALVPNTTEFMNAISFAINGNIALRSAPSPRPKSRH